MHDEAQLIVGAGLAGSAAALLLARGGRRPLLVERRLDGPPRPCGEFVSPEAARGLALLGVDVRALGGHPITRLTLACGDTVIDAALPFTACGLSRQTLDAALQSAAVAAGVRLRRGTRATLLGVPAPGRPFEFMLTPSGHAARADRCATSTLLLASGKTELPPLARRPRREPESLIGWQTHLTLAPSQQRAIEGRVEVVLFDGGYAGLQPVEGGRANLCLLAPPDRQNPGWPAQLQSLLRQSPLLSERLADARWPETPPRTVYRVPYGHVHRASASDPSGLWRLGDQAAVIPSFTGDGIAIALHSAALASAELLDGASAYDYHRRLRRDVGAQIARARWLYRCGKPPGPRRALLALMKRWPGMLGAVASMTRVPPHALRW